MKKLILLLLLPITALSQNMVPNGGFENTVKNPPTQSSSFRHNMFVEDWIPASKSLFGFFHPLSKNLRIKKAGENCHYCGKFDAKSGIGYAGLTTYLPSHSFHLRSYFQVQLIAPLEKNEIYHFSMWIRTSNYAAKFFTSGIGAYLSDSAFYVTPKDLTDHYYINVSPQIFCDSIISNTAKWEKIESYYVAKGDELYLTIGNFFSDTTIKIKENKKLIPSKIQIDYGYVFLDDIVLEKKNPFSELFTNGNIALQEITFQIGKETIENKSKPYLLLLAKFLIQNPGINIEIIGHTDNIGTSENNINLSKKRTESIKAYLLEKGVKNKLILIGKGDLEAIADNTTEEGRQKNRRVEFILINK
jgi:OmpA-OmpF porin, OOP family